MKRLFIAVAFLISISQAAFCINQTTFLGVPWGSSMDTAEATFKDKGFKTPEKEKDYILYRNEKFAGRLATAIALYFSDGKLYQAIVIIIPAENYALIEYDSLKSDLEIGCGRPDSSNAKYEIPYMAGDGKEEEALMENKAELQTMWSFQNNRRIRLRAVYNKDAQRVTIILY